MRLIDADTVVTIQTYDDMYEEWETKTMTVAEALDEFADEGCPPTIDAVEVVRCKDCIFYQPFIQEIYKGKGDCEEHDAMVCDDDFCSYGSRVDEGQNKLK